MIYGRIQPGVPQKAGMREWSRSGLQDQKQNDLEKSHALSKRSGSSRARTRSARTAEYLREAKRRYPSEPDELISTTIEAVSRKYFPCAVKTNRTS
jgi:hypothetical protein